MKKIKLLTSLSALSILGVSTLPLTSCGDQECTVTYTCSDGVTLVGQTSIKVKKGSKWSEFNKPDTEIAVEEDYTRLGWYESGTLTKITKDTVINDNFTAKYCALKNDENFIKVTIQTDKKVYDPVYYVQTWTWKDFKDYYEITEDPQKAGCIFDGWFYGDTKITDDWTFPEQTEIKIIAQFSSSDFLTDSWKNVCEYAKQGLDALKAHYKLQTFIGAERTIKLNGFSHIVRVIGENHDIVADTNTTSVLTFELKTLLSDSEGKAMTSKWDSVNNYDYTNSILRKNLTGNGTPSGISEGDLWNKTALSMIEEENLDLYNNLKVVNKQIATTSAHVVNTYTDKLFPLTYIEMAQTGSPYAAVEGTKYAYWDTHNTKNDRIKYDVSNKIGEYWLISPDISATKRIWSVLQDGGFQIGRAVSWESCTVSFAFCI